MSRVKKEHMSGSSYLKDMLQLLPIFMHKDERKTWHWVVFSLVLICLLGVALEGAIGLESFAVAIFRVGVHLGQSLGYAVKSASQGVIPKDTTTTDYTPYLNQTSAENVESMADFAAGGLNTFDNSSATFDNSSAEEVIRDPCMPPKGDYKSVLKIWGGSKGMGLFAYPLFVINQILYAKRAGFLDFFVYFDCRLGNAYCDPVEGREGGRAKGRDMWKLYFEPVSAINAKRRKRAPTLWDFCTVTKVSRGRLCDVTKVSRGRLCGVAKVSRGRLCGDAVRFSDEKLMSCAPL
jgi:hypothetical protein